MMDAELSVTEEDIIYAIHKFNESIQLSPSDFKFP